MWWAPKEYNERLITELRVKQSHFTENEATLKGKVAAHAMTGTDGTAPFISKLRTRQRDRSASRPGRFMPTAKDW